MTRQTRRALAGLLALATLAAACGDDGGGGSEAAGTDGTTDTSESTDTGGSSEEEAGATIRVPDDHDTIQAAVDAAAPGDLVLVGPGVYEEAVDVETENLTIRGLDRNEVVLDGGFELENGIRVLVDGVTVENMTAQNFTSNGFFWTGVTGYHASYLTAYRNGDYGVYAFDSVKGQIDHVYGSGSPDAGVYIGQCYPCDALITDSISEYNGIGYSGTNAGGNLAIVRSTFRYNRVGIVPNSGSYELCYPQREISIVGNVVHDNNQPDTPAIDDALLAMSNGILLPGGNRDVIERNLVFSHERTGIGLVPYPEEEASDVVPPKAEWDRPCSETRDIVPDPDPDALGLVLWDSHDNRVVGNVVEDSGLADIGLGSLQPDIAGLGNCFSDNTFDTSAPNDIEALAPCNGKPTSDAWDKGVLDLAVLIGEERPPSVDYEKAPTPEPGDQPNMPDAADAPANPAIDVPEAIDLDSVELPERPAGA